MQGAEANICMIGETPFFRTLLGAEPLLLHDATALPATNLAGFRWSMRLFFCIDMDGPRSNGGRSPQPSQRQQGDVVGLDRTVDKAADVLADQIDQRFGAGHRRIGEQLRQPLAAIK